MRLFVDASVIVAILKREPGYEELVKRLIQPGTRFYVSPLVRFEAVAALVRLEVDNLKQRTGSVSAADRAGFIESTRALVNSFIAEIDASEVMIDARVGQAALDAMASYGRTAGHPAALNFGDCYAYAAAKSNRLSLLYEGNDFSQTDLA